MPFRQKQGEGRNKQQKDSTFRFIPLQDQSLLATFLLLQLCSKIIPLIVVPLLMSLFRCLPVSLSNASAKLCDEKTPTMSVGQKNG